jgi:hypothetical protein
METTSKAMPSVGSDAAVVAAGAVAAGVAAGAWVDGRALVCARTIGAQAASHAAATINFHSLQFTRNARGPLVTWLNLFLDPDDCSPRKAYRPERSVVGQFAFGLKGRGFSRADECRELTGLLPPREGSLVKQVHHRESSALFPTSSLTAAQCGQSPASPPAACRTPASALALPPA